MINKIISQFLKYSSVLMIGYSTLTFAKSPDIDYFLDHVIVHPGKSMSAKYSFPTAEHVIECHQDCACSSLGSVEWTFNHYSFKGQIGDARRLTLMRVDSPTWWMGEQGQTADPSGMLTFTNLDKDDLYVTCSYNSPEAKARK